MSNWGHSATISMVTKRCWECGRFFAHESVIAGDCPVCTRKHLVEKVDKICALLKQNRSLRGVITRLKKKAAK